MKKKTKKIAIIGGGPAGFMAAVNAASHPELVSGAHHQIDIYEKSSPLKTILYTGNGRCNLAHNISDFKELASNYPRGEKFLYSIFSRFGTDETLQWFNSRGLETYVQDDNRIFPATDKAASVRSLFLDRAAKLGINIVKSEVTEILKKEEGFKIRTDKGFCKYDILIISTGGNSSNSHPELVSGSVHNNGYAFARKLGHSITPLKPALTTLLTQEKWVKNLAGVSIQNAQVQSFFNNKKQSDLTGDFVFTHTGLAGPAAFNTSSYCAFFDYSRKNPLLLKINFLPKTNHEKLEKELLNEFNNSASKSILNIIRKYIPRSIASVLLENQGITPDKKASVISKEERKKLLKILLETELKIVSSDKEGEIVTAGGVALKEVNPKTMESKLVKNLYFCGEVLDIDGLTGGFNLQSCWSTGYLAGTSIAILKQ